MSSHIAYYPQSQLYPNYVSCNKQRVNVHYQKPPRPQRRLSPPQPPQPRQHHNRKVEKRVKRKMHVEYPLFPYFDEEFDKVNKYDVLEEIAGALYKPETSLARELLKYNEEVTIFDIAQFEHYEPFDLDKSDLFAVIFENINNHDEQFIREKFEGDVGSVNEIIHYQKMDKNTNQVRYFVKVYFNKLHFMFDSVRQIYNVIYNNQRIQVIVDQNTIWTLRPPSY